MNRLGAAWRAHEAALRQRARHRLGEPAQADDLSRDKMVQRLTAAASA